MRQHFLVHGVKLVLTSSNRDFLAFAKEYFRGFEIDTPRKDAAYVADVHVVVQFLPGFSWRLNQSQYAPHVLGGGLGWDEKNNTLYIFENEIEARATLTAPWHAEVKFKKNFFRYLAHRLFFSGSKTKNNYYRSLIRLFAQQLVFMQLALRWQIVGISAAAFKIGGQAHLAVGLPGSGKSTLVSALRRELHAEILAENFALTDGERLFPFPEGQSSDVAPCPIGGIYFLTHGEGFAKYILPREQAYQAMLAVNNLTAELPQHSPYGSLALVDPTRWQFLFDSDNETLKKLCERHSCLRLIADEGLLKTIEYFKNL